MDQADMGENWLDIILKRKSFEESPLKVLDFKIDGGIKKGENYLSKVVKIKAKVLLGSGRTKNVSLIIKNQHATEHLKAMSIDSGIFFREIMMYRDIFPKMEALLEDAGIADEVPWGKCVDIRLYDRLILEDLGMEGYTMADRKKQLGLAASLLVMKAFGIYHGLSRILLQRGEIRRDIFKEHGFPKIDDEDDMVRDEATMLVTKMRAWGDEWKEATQRLENALPDIGKRFKKALEPGENGFAVLAHGDCWTNNMLFKYLEDPENPISVKLLDFQVCFISTPVRDLHMFLTTSVRMDVRDEHLETIIQAYSDSLHTTLKKCNYEGHIPDTKELLSMMEKTAIIGLIDSFMMTLIALGDHDDEPDFEEIIKKGIEEKAKNSKEPDEYSLVHKINPTSAKIIQAAFKKAMNTGVI